MRIWNVAFVFSLITLISIPLYLIGYKFVSNLHTQTHPTIAPAVTAQKLHQIPTNSHKNRNNLDNGFQDSPHFPDSLRSILPRLQQLNCPRLFDWRDTQHINDVLREGRITLVADPPDSQQALNMTCEAIKGRWWFPTVSSALEEQFPLAFARTIYRDYLLIEQLLAVEYAPQNLYCYTLDSKASQLYKRRIRSLASCFPNVFVASKEFDVQSNGKNVSSAHLACLEELLRAAPKEETSKKWNWKYAILLQNQDIPIRTNAEMVEILTTYNGTNEVGTVRISPGSIREDLNWTLESLHLYKDGSNSWPVGERMHHTKSLNLVALSRPAVNFILNRLSLGPFIDQLERSDYGMDEVFMSSLNSNLPDFPGGYTWRCLEHYKQEQEQVARYVIWDNHNYGRCQSGYFRHGVCVMGLEDLQHLHRLRFFLYANKLLPEFDYGAIFCWLRVLANRRFEDHQSANESNDGQRVSTARKRLNLKFYAILPHVRYNRLRATGRFDKFYC